MANQGKKDAVLELKTKLENRSNFILASYSGLTVEDLSNLRAKLSAENSELKVIKNNLFLRALKESSRHKDHAIDFGDEYKGPLAAIFSEDGLPSIAKLCKDFAKDKQNLVVKLGYLDGQVLDGKNVDAIAGLPSKSELLSQIARGLNAPTQQIASGMNQIMASLARAIQKIGEKNG
ncbi:50S ribosomal protein L10 [Leptospira sp. GIMC2001]|uniref:50S ribosomal protein L10 n=1 Tax=Leptospira sp. GIMC2001 TaxID=1513297 RepID=UPI0023493C37|nr:50S ribosomal protein L10 [Leptospira sp. GIMC2001]WCL51071.1 50S ribosomal protein L10 [Leptospira sp. GIMC2001]